MKGATLLATLLQLGFVPSFSRPSVSNDNPYPASLFRTLKYRREYPEGVFASLLRVRARVRWFVDWYNHEHLHSAIQFVTPAQRYAGQHTEILAHREEVYRQARARHPLRWSNHVRNWTPMGDVHLNPATGQAGIKASNLANT